MQNARQSVFWFGITRDVEEICNRCQECQRLKASIQKEDLQADDLPEKPFDVVSADLFYISKKVYMVYVDRLSGFPFINM